MARRGWRSAPDGRALLAGMATLLLLVAEWLVAAAQHLATAFGVDRWDGLRPSPLSS